MNKRIKKLITLEILTINLLSSHFVAYAVDKPTPPKISGEITNDKIKQYNKEVDKYNEAVDEYNKQIDENYEKAIEETKQKNQEVDAHNAAEQEKIEEISAINAQRQEEYNTKYAKYQKDLEIEEKIKSKGFDSTQAYNDYINEVANNPANYSVEQNGIENAVFSIDDSYEVEIGEDSSEPIEEDEYIDIIEGDINVNIQHNFNEYTSVSKNLQIGKNDTITFYSAGAQLTPTTPGNCTFYMHSDDNHSMGYWTLTYVELYCTANISEEDWNNGKVHIVSYREGRKHPGDNTDIDITFNYSWIALQTYPTYDVPEEPTLELEEYDPDIWEHYPDPKKEEYLTHLKHKNLIDEDKPKDPEPEPEKEEPKVETLTPAVEAPKSQPIITQTGIPRMARTEDINDITKRYIIIIICIASIAFLLFVNIKKK